MSDDFEDIALPEPPSMDDLPNGQLDQAGIDALFGFDPVPVSESQRGLKALIESNATSHDRLPMLEVVCDRMVRAFATSLRNLTSDAVEISLEDVATLRFGDVMNRLALPAMIGVFNVPEWDNYGIVTVESGLIYGIVDALLGGRKHNASLRVEGRAFTAIETNLVSRMIKLALQDLSASFEAIAPITMNLERIETSPRFAAIAGPTNVAAVASFIVDIDGRGGKMSVVLPYATIEPIREKLLQRFLGERKGRLNIWEDHLASEIRKTTVAVDVILGEVPMMIADALNLEVGDTLALGTAPDTPVLLSCRGVPLGTGLIGQRAGKIAVAMYSNSAEGASR